MYSSHGQPSPSTLWGDGLCLLLHTNANAIDHAVLLSTAIDHAVLLSAAIDRDVLHLCMYKCAADCIDI